LKEPLMLRVTSALTDQEERLVTRTMDCGFAVSRFLGPGFRECIYERAMGLELHSRGLAFEREKAIEVQYREWKIPGQRIDLIVEGVVLVEIKSVPRLRPLHDAQVRSYLKTTGLRVGLLMNFNVVRFKDGFRRIVNTTG
jgi:GxxExxY protein